MTQETIRIDVDGRGVAWLTLARAEKHNALSAAMIDELSAAAHRLGADPAVRAVILAGEGTSFCAGGDLNWMRAQFDADRAGRIAEARRLAGAYTALNGLPKPLVARVHGSAFGGGIGILSVCDAVIATPAARFGLTETRLGLISAIIGPYVVARIGEGRARPLFMSGKIIDAWQAHAAGLVTRVVPVEALDEAVEAEIRPYLLAAPGAVGRAKALVRSLGPPITGAIVDASIERLADAWETEEAREGISAFFERREPRWRQE